MMTRFVLTLLIGLVVSLGTLVSGGLVFAKGEVFWEGTVNSQPVQVTTEGVFLSGKFRSAFQLRDDKKCIYYQLWAESFHDVLKDKPWLKGKTGDTWGRALTDINFDFSECETLAKQFKRSNKILPKATSVKATSASQARAAHKRKIMKLVLSKDDFSICTIVNRGPSCVGTTCKLAAAEAERRGLDCSQKKYYYKMQTVTSQAERGKWSDTELCSQATSNGKWAEASSLKYFVEKAMKRGLACGVGGTQITSNRNLDSLAQLEKSGLCNKATINGQWETKPQYLEYVREAKRRGLTPAVCTNTEITKRKTEQLQKKKVALEIEQRERKAALEIKQQELTFLKALDDKRICSNATKGEYWEATFSWETAPAWTKYVEEAKRRGLSCGVSGSVTASGVTPNFNTTPDYIVCLNYSSSNAAKREAKRRGLSCGVGEASSSTQTASAPVPKAKSKVTSAALTASEKEAERLRQRVAALEAKQQKQQQTISSDTKLPMITIASTSSNGPQGIVKGRVTDNTGIAEVRVDGQLVKVDSFGNFMANTYVPEGGVSVSIQAVDLAGLSSSMSVRLDRSASNTVASISFERLNPLGRKVAKNKDALALIIGVDGYKSTPARAIYADSDAKVFTDYASQKLGIPSNRIKTLVNDGAGEREMLLSVKSWLSRASKPGKSDVYVFFAGHGLASDDGQKMYLLPYDGAPELLDDTAILRDRLFSDIASANPRSVTVFLDTCYSGTTRGTDMLIASRPIAIKALEQSIPDNFTVFTAAAGDQTAKPLEEAKHGMFSYFLMKGMEGEADKNSDNKITAGELHQYVQANVVQQSSGSQTPELQGDSERVLVRFQ